MDKYNFFGIGLINGAVLQGRYEALISYNIGGKQGLKTASKQRFRALRDIPFIRGLFVFINYIITFFSAMDISLVLLNENLLSERVEHKLKVRADLMKFYGLVMLMALISFVIMPVGIYLVLYFFVPPAWANFTMTIIRGLSICLFLVLLKVFKTSRKVYKYNYAINKINNAMVGTKSLDYIAIKLNKGQSVYSASNFMVLSLLLAYMIVPLISFPVHFLLDILIKITTAILFICLAYEVLYSIEYGYRKNAFVKVLSYPFLALSMLTTVPCKEEDIKAVSYGYEELIQMTTTRKSFDEKRASFRKVYNDIKTRLYDGGIIEAREADYLICDTLGLDRTALITKDSFTDEEIKQLNKVVKQRINRKPLCKILGRRNFYGRDFVVNQNVLSPRQETEILTNMVIDELEQRKTGKKVLDLCTGSGAIGITIALETKAVVTCSDKSKKALDIANQNAQNLKAKVQIIKSDMFKDLNDCGKFDIIVSNPPYIPSKDIETLDEEVKNYDPILALDGGDDGLDFYKIIAKKAADYLNKNGKLYLEIGYSQGQDVAYLLRDNFENIEIKKDYDGLDRIIVATKRDKK